MSCSGGAGNRAHRCSKELALFPAPLMCFLTFWLKDNDLEHPSVLLFQENYEQMKALVNQLHERAQYVRLGKCVCLSVCLSVLQLDMYPRLALNS